MEWSKEETMFEELENMETRLLEDGLRPNADPVERLLHLWHLYLRTEGSMNAARLEVKALQGAHDRENMEVQKKLDQVHVLIAKQNSFNVKHKEENQRLHAQLKQLQLDQEALRVEVTELLDQGGLGEIVTSSPSEQVAYLLAERSSLLERLQALEAEKCLEPLAVFKDGMDKLSFHKAMPSRGQSSWKKLLGLRKTAQSKPKLAVSSDEVRTEDSRSEQLRLERDLDEASCRLSMAHKEIRRLTDELESAHMTLKTHEAKLQEVEFLKQEAEKLRIDDMSELHKAKELNERLDKEIRILRDRVRSMDNERVALLALVDKQMMAKKDEEDEECPQKPLPKVEKTDIGIQAIAEMEIAHLRCLEDLKAKDLELRKLQAGLQQLQQELSEKQLQREQAQQLLGEQEQSHRSTVEALKKELEFLGTVVKHTQAEQQESQKALIDDRKDQECLLQQKAEECAEMKKDLGHTTGLLRTAEAEVLSGKEKISELEKLNAELNRQMVAEQQEALAKMSELEKNHESQSAELKKLLEKSKELQHHLDMEQNSKRQIEQDQECLLQQKAEECAEMKKDLGHTMGLLRTAEAEVLSGKEKITELEKLNAELNQRMVAEQQEALARMSELEKSHESQSAELKKLLEKSKELQHHLATEQNLKRQIEQDQECLLQQKAEECAEMKKDLGHTMGLLRTAEAEVLSGKERITELEKLNAELNHRMVAEQQEALARISELEKNHESQSAEFKKLLEKSKELQHHLDMELNWKRQIEQDQECLLQQKAEECAEMKKDLGHTMGLLRTAEAEVLSGKEKITELEKLNAELDHKNQQMIAEQQEALARVSELEKKYEFQSAELQKLLDKSKEIQCQMDTGQKQLQDSGYYVQEKGATASDNICNLDVTVDFMQQRRQWPQSEGEFQQMMENLLKESDTHRKSAMQKQCLIDKLLTRQKNNAEVLELQEEVKNLTLQLELVKAENERLNEANDLNADLPTLRAQAQVAEKQRKWWLCSEKDLEQQIKTLEDKLASMTLSEQEFQRQVVDLKAKLLFMEKTEHAAKLDVPKLQEQVKNLKLHLELMKVAHERLNETKDQAQDSEKQRQLQRCSEKDLEIKTLQDKLASMTLSEHEFHHQVVDLQVKVQEMEKTEQATKLELEKYHEVEDQLHACQKKLQSFAEEMHTILDAKDKELRCCHGKINQLKGKLSQAKIIHIKEMQRRDDEIQEHQRQCDLLMKKVHKVTETTKKMDEVNANLLKENRLFQSELLQEKEAQDDTMRILMSHKLRIEYFEKLTEKMENYILDQLWNNGQKTGCPGAPQSVTNQSTFPRGDTKRDLLDIIHSAPTLVQSEDTSPAQSSARTHSSENSYLNLTPPVSPPSCHSQAESSDVVSEETLQADNRRSCLTERFL